MAMVEQFHNIAFVILSFTQFYNQSHGSTTFHLPFTLDFLLVTYFIWALYIFSIDRTSYGIDL